MKSIKIHLDKKTYIIGGVALLCACVGIAVGVYFLLVNGDEFYTKIKYKADGSVEVEEHYRSEDDSLAWKVFYSPDNIKQQVQAYTADDILNSIERYRADGTLQEKDYYNEDGITLGSKWYYRLNGKYVDYIEYYDSGAVLKQIERYTVDGMLEKTEYYNPDGTLRETEQHLIIEEV